MARDADPPTAALKAATTRRVQSIKLIPNPSTYGFRLQTHTNLEIAHLMVLNEIESEYVGLAEALHIFGFGDFEPGNAYNMKGWLVLVLVHHGADLIISHEGTYEGVGERYDNFEKMLGDHPFCRYHDKPLKKRRHGSQLQQHDYAGQLSPVPSL